jgi:hypothetical protein
MGEANLSVDTRVIEQIFQLPDGYTIVGVTYDAANRIINFSLTSDFIPSTARQATLKVHREILLPEYPEYQKIISEIEVL